MLARSCEHGHTAPRTITYMEFNKYRYVFKCLLSFTRPRVACTSPCSFIVGGTRLIDKYVYAIRKPFRFCSDRNRVLVVGREYVLRSTLYVYTGFYLFPVGKKANTTIQQRRVGMCKSGPVEIFSPKIYNNK